MTIVFFVGNSGRLINALRAVVLVNYFAYFTIDDTLSSPFYNDILDVSELSSYAVSFKIRWLSIESGSQVTSQYFLEKSLAALWSASTMYSGCALNPCASSPNSSLSSLPIATASVTVICGLPAAGPTTKGEAMLKETTITIAVSHSKRFSAVSQT